MPTPELNLTDEQICETFPRLVQYDGIDFYDGLGNLIPRPNGYVGAPGTFTTENPIGIKDAINKNFFTSQQFVQTRTKIFRNGLRLSPGLNNDYTETGLNRFTFIQAPHPTDNILVEYEVNSQGTSVYRTNQILIGARNAINLIFSTQEIFLSGTAKVYRNGLRLTIGITNDYVESANNEITFNQPPFSTDNLIIDFSTI